MPWVQMKLIFFVALVVIVGIVSAGSESYVNVDAYVGGGGGIFSKHTTESSVGDGVDTNRNTISAGSRVITGPGNNQYYENATLDASTGNTYDSSSELISDGGYVYDDTSSMTDIKIAIPELEDASGINNETGNGQTPSHQSVTTHASGMGDYVHYTADKVIEDANMTVDYIAEGGSGVFDVSIDALMEAGMSKKSNKMDYQSRFTDRKTAYGNTSSMFEGKVSMKYRDFSRPMGFGDANTTVTVEEAETNVGMT